MDRVLKEGLHHYEVSRRLRASAADMLTRVCLSQTEVCFCSCLEKLSMVGECFSVALCRLYARIQEGNKQGLEMGDTKWIRMNFCGGKGSEQWACWWGLLHAANINNWSWCWQRNSWIILIFFDVLSELSIGVSYTRQTDVVNKENEFIFWAIVTFWDEYSCTEIYVCNREGFGIVGRLGFGSV